MKIIKYIVDELPESCRECMFCAFEFHHNPYCKQFCFYVEDANKIDKRCLFERENKNEWRITA
jgi:hypothetical protein